jgi:predicted nucleic acid-binding protein
MIVVDTNVIAHLLLATEFQSVCYAIYKKDPEWIAPILWRSEYTNVLAKYMRADLMSPSDANLTMMDALDLMENRDFFANPSTVIKLLSMSKVSAYDAEFIALAIETRNRLISFDQKLINLFPDVAMHPSEFIASASS